MWSIRTIRMTWMQMAGPKACLQRVFSLALACFRFLWRSDGYCEWFAYVVHPNGFACEGNIIIEWAICSKLNIQNLRNNDLLRQRVSLQLVAVAVAIRLGAKLCVHFPAFDILAEQKKILLQKKRTKFMSLEILLDSSFFGFGWNIDISLWIWSHWLLQMLFIELRIISNYSFFSYGVSINCDDV